MIALGVFHHGNPDWYYLLDNRQQTEVNAVLDLLQSEDALRFDLPVPMGARLFGELTGKLQRKARRGSPKVVVRKGKRTEPADAATTQQVAPYAAGMARAAMLKAGATEAGLDFWFGKGGGG